MYFPDSRRTGATKLLKKINRWRFPLRNMENKGLAADSNFF